MKEYRITLLKALVQMIGEILSLIVVIYTINHLFLSDSADNSDIQRTIIALFFLIIITSLLLGYPFFINYNHYKYDKNTKVLINLKEGKIIYTSQYLSKEFLISDITYITCYSAPFRAYVMHYYKVFLKDGTNIDITSLIFSKLPKELKKIKQGQERDNDLRLYRKK